MRKKFVQIASLALAAAALAVVAVSAAWYDPNTGLWSTDPGFTEPGDTGTTVQPGSTTDYSGIGGQLMRIGIYFGSSAKESAELRLVTGDGFEIGYYDDSNQFIALTSTTAQSLTVQRDTLTGIVSVLDGSTGMSLYAWDGYTTANLGVRPYSLAGEKTVVKCGYPYYGGLRFTQDAGGGMTVVNIVPLDDYVKGVVPYEMSPSWPVEALKAQAVCARTYALTHIKTTHQRSYGFDLCDTTCCQAYKGVYSGSQSAKVLEAVDGTSGVTMMYNGQYCDAVYSSSNGGGSESAVNVWGKDIPYLVGKADPYEALVSIPNYNWSVSYTGAELQAKLIAAGYEKCGLVTEVHTAHSGTGNVTSLTFIDANGKSWTIYNTSGGGSKCRTLLSLRSIHYTVSSDSGAASGSGTSGSGWTVNGGGALDFSSGIAVIDGNGNITMVTEGSVITANGVESIGSAASGSGASGTVFTFNGSGWGHNVGMSQYGAYAMAQQGYAYQQILEFYYTGVTIG